MQSPDVVESLAGFVSYDRQRTPFGEPCMTVQVVCRHRLLYHYHALLFQPSCHVQSHVSVLPALIRIYAYGSGRIHAAYEPYHPAVLLFTHSEFDFQDFGP